MNKRRISGIRLFMLIAILALSLSLLAPPTNVYASGIVRVQGPAQGTSGGSATFTVTLGSGPASGDLMVLTVSAVSVGSPAPTVSSVTETGVTWSKAVGKPNNNVDSEIWYGIVSSGAGTTITISLTKGVDEAIADACEYSGLTSSPLDRTTSTTGTTVASNTGTTATTSAPNELLVGSIAAQISPSTSQSQTTNMNTNGFTLVSGNTIASVTEGYLENIVSSTGTYSSSTTLPSGTSYTWAGAIATFAAAPSINLNPTSGNPNTMVTMTGANFNPADTCNPPASTTSNPSGLIASISICSFSSGKLTLVFQVSSTANDVPYTVTVTGSTGDSASASFTVTAPTVGTTTTTTVTTTTYTTTTSPTTTYTTTTSPTTTYTTTTSVTTTTSPTTTYTTTTSPTTTYTTTTSPTTTYTTTTSPTTTYTTTTSVSTTYTTTTSPTTTISVSTTYTTTTSPTTTISVSTTYTTTTSPTTTHTTTTSVTTTTETTTTTPGTTVYTATITTTTTTTCRPAFGQTTCSV